MAVPLKKLEADALELPPHERAELAHRLLISLDEDAAADLVEVERAWAEEIQRRVTELDAGTAELIPAEEVLAELRARPRR